MQLPSRTTGLALGGAAIALVAVAGLPRIVHAGEVLPGTWVNEVDLGGLSRAEATEVLSQRFDALESTPVSLLSPETGDELAVVPASFGWDLDVDAAIEAAMARGRDGNPLADTWTHLTARFGDELLAVEPTWDADRLAATVASLAEEVDEDAGTGSLDADPDTLEVTAVKPPRGYALRVDEAEQVILDAAIAGPEPEVRSRELPVEVTEAPVTLAQVEAAAERAEAAIAQPIRLFQDGGVEVVLEPADLATVVGLRVVEDEILLAADAAALEPLFADVVEALEKEAVNARLDVPRLPDVTLDEKGPVTWEPRPARVGLIPSVPGATFDAELAAAQLGDLFESGQREAKLALREVRAEYTTEDLEALGITHLLGTFTTYHPCCQARVHNIQTLADMVHGTVVEPGEQFSINQISGERTCQKGFRPAGMILNGELVDSCGGGVSQFGTTTFNAAFFAGLQLDAWKAHSWYLSRYPMGREATLNFPSPDIDVRFTNDTGHGLYVATGHTSTSITVSIYGQSDVTKVEATRSGTYNPRGFTTQRRPNPELAPGQEVRVQSGAGGFTVRVTRLVHRGDDVDEQEIVTVYSPVREIIEYGPGEPQPQPSPSGSPSPQPSQSPSPQPSQSPSPQPSQSPSPQPSQEPSPEPSPSETPPGGGGSGGGGG